MPRRKRKRIAQPEKRRRGKPEKPKRRHGLRIALALILLSALATGAGQDPRILEWDPAGFPGECFVEQRIFLKKTGILLLEAAAVVAEAGRFFCRRDIFAAEGDG